MDGLEAAREIRDRFPDVGVIMLTAYDDRQFVVEAVRSGARGYVLKARDAEHLIQTVRLVAGGNMVIDPQLVVALAEELSTAKERDRKAETLTAREIEVLQLLAFGHTNRTSPSASTSRPTRSRPTSSTSSRSSAPPTVPRPSRRRCGGA